MSWAEFVLRSFAFKEKREFEMSMVREISYEIYRGHFIFSKKKPVKKDKYWPIAKKVSKVGSKTKALFLKKFREYKIKVDGNS